MRISDWSSDVCSSDLLACPSTMLRMVPLPRWGRNGRSPPQSRRPPAGIGIIALRRLAVERVHAHRAARFDLGRLRFDQLHDMADPVGVGDMVVGDPREEDHMLAVASAGDAYVGLARFPGPVDDAAPYRERPRGLLCAAPLFGRPD